MPALQPLEPAMKDVLQIERATLFSALAALLYPNPEDPDSPVGPRTHIGGQQRGALAALNPQPLPPRWQAEVAGTVQHIEAGIRSAQFSGQAEGAMGAARTLLKATLSGWCGNEPRPFPFPAPGPTPDPDPVPWRAVEQLRAAVYMSQLARFQSPLQGDYAAGAAQLLDAALKAPR
jgi:hypothetical protein